MSSPKRTSRPPSRSQSRPPSRGNPITERIPVIIKSSVWSFDCNRPESFPNTEFSGEIGKDTKSKGTWFEDYSNLCNIYQITPCPYWKSYEENGQTIVSLSNCKIDKSNFRAGMIALSMTGSRVNELWIHNTELSPQNIIDLGFTLSKLCFIKTLKLEYLYFDSSYSINEYVEAYKSFTSCDFGSDYLSFRGSKLGDILVESMITILATNSSIKSINLCDCNLTDISFSKLIVSLRTNSGLESISVANNQIIGTNIIDLFPILSGILPSQDDTNVLKFIQKKNIERGKKLKEINKKRRKMSIYEFNENTESVQTDRTVKASNGSVLICNRIFKYLDISYNPINTNMMDDFLRSFSLDSIVPLPSDYVFTLRAKELIMSESLSRSDSVTVIN